GDGTVTDPTREAPERTKRTRRPPTRAATRYGDPPSTFDVRDQIGEHRRDRTDRERLDLVDLHRGEREILRGDRGGDHYGNARLRDRPDLRGQLRDNVLEERVHGALPSWPLQAAGLGSNDAREHPLLRAGLSTLVEATDL